MKSKFNILNYLTFGIGLLSFSSCASLTGYQDGRSVGEGNGEAMISINASQSPTFVDIEEEEIIEDIPTFLFPNIELGGRYGVTEKLDVTLKMNTNLNLSVGGKYQLLGDRTSKFALGTGFELGTFGLITGLWNVQVPVYASVHPTEKFTFYASPKYIYQFTSLGGLAGWNYLGGNIGLLFGSKHKFGLDLGYFALGTSETSRISLISVGIGGKFVFGDNFPDSTPTKTKKKRK
jgi:hypothetical protein